MIFLIVILFFLLLACMHARPLPTGWAFVNLAVSSVVGGVLNARLGVSLFSSSYASALTGFLAVTLLTHNLIVLAIYRRRKGP